MLTSLAIMIIVGLCLSKIFEKFKLPGLLGMIITGIIIGPYCLNMVDKSILSISSDLRQFALIVILTRAGLTLNISELIRIGRPGIMLCFIPALFEITATVIIAPILFNITHLEAGIIGAVIAAVSPAIVVPRMIHLIGNGYGKKHLVPQMILAGASVDDVFVIVVFTSLTSLAQGASLSPMSFLSIPISIILGSLYGVAIGFTVNLILSKIHIRDTGKMMILLAISFLMMQIQNIPYIPISPLIGIMAMGITINRLNKSLCIKLSTKYNKLWVFAELMLFILVGTTVDISYTLKTGLLGIILVVSALIIRMIGVYVSVIGTQLTQRERLFSMIAYTPKATVQAAIGSIPLSMGLPCGHIVLSIAVLSILITAPFGAIAIDKSYKVLLQPSKEKTFMMTNGFVNHST